MCLWVYVRVCVSMCVSVCKCVSVCTCMDLPGHALGVQRSALLFTLDWGCAWLQLTELACSALLSGSIYSRPGQSEELTSVLFTHRGSEQRATTDTQMWEQTQTHWWIPPWVTASQFSPAPSLHMERPSGTQCVQTTLSFIQSKLHEHKCKIYNTQKNWFQVSI